MRVIKKYLIAINRANVMFVFDYKDGTYSYLEALTGVVKGVVKRPFKISTWLWHPDPYASILIDEDIIRYVQRTRR